MKSLENYLKAVLYAYPLLKNIEEDYETHIRNKALLSYDSNWATERLAEYLAEEILHKNKLLWLRKVIETALDKLSGTERLLMGLRYFGKARGKKPTGEEGVQEPYCWSERKYFRVQNRLSQKVTGIMVALGLTKAYFDEELSELDEIKKIYRFVEMGRDREIAKDERRWLGGNA